MLNKHLFDKKYSNNSNIKYYYKVTFLLNILYNVIYFCDAKLYFQHHYSSLQCHMILQKSFHDDNLAPRKHFFYVENSIIYIYITVYNII